MKTPEKIPLPYLLAGLYRAEFNGKLQLEEGDVKRTIVLNDGQPVQVLSRSQEETLGRVLLDEGMLTEQQYDQMLEEMISTKKPAGEILIKLGILGPHEIFNALEFQLRKKLSNTFRMVDFRFSLEKKTVPLEMLISKVDIVEAILSGILSCYSVDRILDEFPAHEETIFMYVESGSTPVKLAIKELKLIRSLGRGKSLSKIMSSGLDLKYLLSILYALHTLGVVEASEIKRPFLPEFEKEHGQSAPMPAPKSVPHTVVNEKSEEEEFRTPTLDNIMKRRINTALAQKVLQMGRENHFSLLGVDKSATRAQLQEAYAKFISIYNLSDIENAYSDNKEKELARRLLKRASTALEVLTKEASRQTYSESLDKDDSDKKDRSSARILADIKARKATEAIQVEDWDEAELWLQRAISLYPKEPSYYFQLGRVGFLRAIVQTPQDQKLDDSLKDPFLKAMKLDPHYDQPRLYLGYFAKRNGDYKQALLEMQGAIECNPQNKVARSELRLLRRRIREKAEDTLED